MTTRDLANAPWFKSTYSSDTGACVEVAALPDTIAARDSKDRNGPVLTFTRQGWQDFIQGIHADEFRP